MNAKWLLWKLFLYKNVSDDFFSLDFSLHSSAKSIRDVQRRIFKEGKEKKDTPQPYIWMIWFIRGWLLHIPYPSMLYVCVKWFFFFRLFRFIRSLRSGLNGHVLLFRNLNYPQKLLRKNQSKLFVQRWKKINAKVEIKKMKR